MGTEWTADERRKLRKRWRKKGAFLRMPGACPHCGHDGAFAKISVPREIVAHTAGRIGTSDVLSDLAFDGDFPESFIVTCGCGEHDDAGCGRRGTIPTS